MRGKREATHSVHYLGRQKLDEMFERGKSTSKHKDKIANKASGQGYVPDASKIYIDHTLHDYAKHWEDYCDAMRAADFKVDGHRPRTLDEAAKFMPDYIDILKSRPGKTPGSTYSAWTIRAYFAGCAKVLGLSAKDYDLPTRRRRDIVRSRGTAARDKHFSEKNNAELVNFCKCTGLRNKSELQKITGANLTTDKDGNPAIRIVGKGKKERISRIIGTPEQIQQVVQRMQNAGDNKVWPHVPSCADIHDYRAVYAQNYYNMLARDPKDIPLKERYCCKGDQKGKWYDRKAVIEVSKQLGHARANVIVEHYLGRH